MQDLWGKGGPLAPLDLLVNKVFQVWRAERGPRGSWGHWDPLAKKGHLDPGASLVRKEPLGTLDLLV